MSTASSAIQAGQRWREIGAPDHVMLIHGPVDHTDDAWDVSIVGTGNRMMRTTDFIVDSYELDDSGS